MHKFELIDYKFNDYRDWFLPEEEKFKEVDVLLINVKKRVYRVNNIPYRCSTIKVFMPLSLDSVRKAVFKLQNHIFDYTEVRVRLNLQKGKNGCIVTFVGFEGSLIEEKTKLSRKIHNPGRIRSWKNPEFNDCVAFEYEK